MKFILRSITLITVFIFIPFGMLFAQEEAEVSERKEIALFPMFTTYQIPTGAAVYFDNTLVKEFSDMKRFKVVGYQYRLDYRSAEQFIDQVRTLKKEQINADPEYKDADLGITVIPADEMRKLANSFFIIIPSISGYSVKIVNVEVEEYNKRGQLVIKVIPEYHVEATLSVKVINAEGELLDTYNSSYEEVSRESEIKAFYQSINKGVEGFNYFLRSLDDFKIKTRVLGVKGQEIFIELGDDLGIKPGYEFEIRQEERIGDFTDTVTKGVVRVKEVRSRSSRATVIYGSPQVNDSLIEHPTIGSRFSLYTGVASMNIPESFTLRILYEDESIASDTIDVQKIFYPSLFVPAIGMNYENELGYAGLLLADAGFLLNFPFSAYADAGAGYQFYLFPRFTFTASAMISIIAAYTPLGRVDPDISGSYFKVNDTRFYEPVDISLINLSPGLKPKADFHYRLGKNMSVGITAGYGLYLNPSSMIRFQGTGSEAGGENNEGKEELISIPNAGTSFQVNGTEASSIPVYYSGPFGGLELKLYF